jgi:UDP-glucose 4-epimerase
VRTDWDSPAQLAEICQEIDAVVHLAGLNAADSQSDPIAALTLNAVATARLVEASVRQGVRRFIYFSTAHVYRSPLVGIITEETCPASLHPYATSHRAGEDVVRAKHQRGEIEGIVIRLSNTYGAPVDKDANCWMLLVNDLCRQAVTTRRMVLRSSGLQRRDFIALTDVCEAVDRLLGLAPNQLENGLFNLGGGWSPTVLEMTERVAERVNAVAGFRPDIERPAAQSDERSEALDFKIDKLMSVGFAPGDRAHVDHEIDGLIRFCFGS